MFGIGVPELVLILIIGLVVFGPGKLPEIGKAVGKSLNEFKKATNSLTAEDDKNTIQSQPMQPQQPAQPAVQQSAAAPQPQTPAEKPEEKK